MKHIALVVICNGCALVSIKVALASPENVWLCGWIGACGYAFIRDVLREYRPRWVG